MLPSTWNTLLDDLRAYGARRQQRRAQRSAQQAEIAVDDAASLDARKLAGSETEDNGSAPALNCEQAETP